jgi:hypothetical protein
MKCSPWTTCRRSGHERRRIHRLATYLEDLLEEFYNFTYSLKWRIVVSPEKRHDQVRIRIIGSLENLIDGDAMIVGVFGELRRGEILCNLNLMRMVFQLHRFDHDQSAVRLSRGV